MDTMQLYYQDPYQKECDCKIAALEESFFTDSVGIILDRTIFYPEGGGQPCDQGVIVGDTFKFVVTSVRMVDGEILHYGNVEGDLHENLVGKAQIDWERRFLYMRLHSAGHLVHDVLLSKTKGLNPSKGSHGKKAYLEYTGKMATVVSKEELETAVNKAIEQDLVITTQDVSYEELQQLCEFVPDNIPKDKKLRMLRIGDFPAMPDGGVQVASTKEIGKVSIPNLNIEPEKVTVHYRVGF